MSGLEFIFLVLDHIGLVSALCVGLPVLLYFATRKVVGDISDPFHFFYSFSYGTAYAVVCLLAFTGHIHLEGIAVVGGYGLLFLMSFGVFARFPLWRPPASKKPIAMGGKTLFALVALSYFAIAIVFLEQVGFAAFLTSRFEIGRYNLLAIIMDPLRLFIAGYLAIVIVKCQGGNARAKRLLLSLVELAFIAFSSLINGSKVSFLESAYAGAVAIVVSRGGKPIPWKKAKKPVIAVVAIATIYAVSQQYLNLRASGNSAAENPALSVYTKGPLLLDLFAMRIVNNGDIYYYVLPEPVFHNIVIDHPFALMFGDVFGGQLMQSLFGIDMTRSVDIGHQAMGYWYGAYNGSVGPTDHFDLDAYKFFGPWGGIIFVLCLAFILSLINRLKKGHYDSAGCAVVAAVYIRSLILLLSPHVGLAYMEESIILFAVLGIMARGLNYSVTNPRHVFEGERGNSSGAQMEPKIN